MRPKGLTLLEVMVALVIFGMAGVAYLQLFGDSLRVMASARAWSRAVEHAEEAMEEVKRIGTPPTAVRVEQLDGGYTRWVEAHAWDEGVVRVTAIVTLPGGGRMELDRLVEVR